MCEASGPRACERTSSEQFRMQFDWVNVQQCLQTLQFQRCECVARYRVGGNCMRHSSIADPTGVMRCRRRRSWWRRQWSSRWRTGGMAWWALSALANCPLMLNVHTWLRVRPRIGRVGVFMPPDETIPLNTDFPLPAQRKAAT